MGFVLGEPATVPKPEAGSVLLMHGLCKEALPYLLDKVRDFPHDPSGWSDLGMCYKHLGDFQKGIEYVSHALSITDHGAINSNLALIYEDVGEFDKAEQHYRKAVAMLGYNVNAWTAQYGLAGCLLRRGAYEEAWPLWQRSRAYKSYVIVPQIPMWEGQDLSGKRVLVTREGGHGDAFWMMRYIRFLKQLGAKEVGFNCSNSAATLFYGHPWIDRLIYAPNPIHQEEWDFQVPLMSIMAILYDRLPYLPFPLGMDEPYLKADKAVEFPHPAVGLCWKAGEVVNWWRPHRGIERNLVDKFADIPVHWVSLQYGEPCPWWAEDAQRFMTSGWKGTAELIAGLDLVVTADTAIAHLAGALGIPTIVFVPVLSDWKFGLTGSTNPWYPNWTVVRNTDPLSFAPAVEEILSLLRERFPVPMLQAGMEAAACE